MEPRESGDPDKPWRRTARGSWRIDDGSADVSPGLLSDEAGSSGDDAEIQEEPRHHVPIQRNSIFNRTVRHRSKGGPERRVAQLAGSQDSRKSARGPPAASLHSAPSPEDPEAREARASL